MNVTDSTWEQLKSFLLLIFGASGWSVAIVKLITDLREDRRKEREDLRKEREAEHKERDSKIRAAEQLAPFITELNSGDLLFLYKEFKRNGDLNEDGSHRTREQRGSLMGFPAKLEEIGALMLAGKFSQAEVYEHFGEQILTCEAVDKVWDGEDPHYWKIFGLLADSMKRERTLRGLLSNKDQ